jgi:hypothetical protein
MHHTQAHPKAGLLKAQLKYMYLHIPTCKLLWYVAMYPGCWKVIAFVNTTGLHTCKILHEAPDFGVCRPSYVHKRYEITSIFWHNTKYSLNSEFGYRTSLLCLRIHWPVFENKISTFKTKSRCEVAKIYT